MDSLSLPLSFFYRRWLKKPRLLATITLLPMTFDHHTWWLLLFIFRRRVQSTSRKTITMRQSPESRSAPSKRSSKKWACGASSTLASTIKMVPSSRCPLRRLPRKSRSPRSPSTTTWCSWGQRRNSVSTLTSITMTKSAWSDLSFARRRKRKENAFLSRRRKLTMRPPEVVFLKPQLRRRRAWRTRWQQPRMTQPPVMAKEWRLEAVLRLALFANVANKATSKLRLKSWRRVPLRASKLISRLKSEDDALMRALHIAPRPLSHSAACMY